MVWITLERGVVEEGLDHLQVLTLTQQAHHAMEKMEEFVFKWSLSFPLPLSCPPLSPPPLSTTTERISTTTPSFHHHSHYLHYHSPSFHYHPLFPPPPPLHPLSLTPSIPSHLPHSPPTPNPSLSPEPQTPPSPTPQPRPSPTPHPLFPPPHSLQVWEDRCHVIPHDVPPDWLQDNNFLLHGHRPPMPSFRACFYSIFRLHTETGNIWTHLLGFLFFLFFGVGYMFQPNINFVAPVQEKVVFGMFFLGAILCLCFSWLFHTVYCHSENSRSPTGLNQKLL